MVIPDNGDTINVSPGRLRETAGMFQKASQDTFDLLNTLQGTARQLVGDMYSELHHSPTALEQLCTRWSTATTSLEIALMEVAHNMSTAADNYQSADQKGMPKN
jgi:uncharacterized protein YukE